jgi:signal transduction histidine kinase
MGNLALDRAYTSQRSFSEQIGKRFVAVFLICLGLINAKSPDALLKPQFWAEDGSIFYAQQFGRTWPLLFAPYAGYLHFAPRLIAWLASDVGPARMPFVYNLSAIIIQALCVAYAVTRMSFWFGAVIALFAFFLTPTAGDIFGAITNIQWVAQFALIFGLLRSALDRPYRLGDGVAAALILVASLTGPFSVIFALSIILLWLAGLVGRSLHWQRFAESVGQLVSDIEPTRLAALFLGATAQIVTMATHTVRTPTNAITGKEQELFGWANNVFLRTMAGWGSKEQRLLDAIYLIIFISMVVIAIRQINAANLLKVFLLSIGAVQPIFAYLKQQMNWTLSPLTHYFYFFGVIAFCCVALMAMSAPIKYRLGLIASAAACLALFFVMRPQYLIRAPLVDCNWPAYAARISAGEHNVVVPLNPGFEAVINVSNDSLR